ncbi:MocR-like pyridoxine biosynthesis transcription factor PdxR [Chitinophaga japonensis]|uniref:GntR family transcriptional regulator/MocR family aminotransferase n=1 Tax=Chitinophaga japonensis TaxID=104662 RepID=A0A562T5W2_CHIJA|nr:PLP-dependent aminotransferase family protein [Chitinophaga japonensis]TWI88753.1 GntR family transcriptional regulator/MocR family aminotransferase [Chitinophaga japonensis]
MSKTPPQIFMPFLRLDKRSADPLYLQLYEQVKQAIFGGRLKEGERMPSTRTLAAELSVSRNSVFLAYEQLMLEGFLQGKKGDGTYVCVQLDRAPQRPAAPAPARPKAASRADYRDSALPQHILQKDSAIEPWLPFQSSVPDVQHFPFKTWARIAAGIYRDIQRLHLGYGDTQGHLPLREALADYLRINRSIVCTPEQVLIVNGSRQAINLAAQVLLKKGDACWVEDPGYQSARGAITRWGGKLCPVPLTSYGLDIDYAVRHYPDAKLAYVTPSHQYPLGGTLPLGERLKLLQWAAKRRMWIVEDDYDSEFRYNGRPVPALKGLDDKGRVIYTGTFSKVLFPALRLGYMVLPSADMARQFKMVKSTIDRQSPVIDQAIVAQFMEEGHFARHLRRMRTLYKKQQDELVRLLEKHLSRHLEVAACDTGMHLVAWLRHPCNVAQLEKKALKENMILQSVSDYVIRFKQRPGLILGFTGFSAGVMERAVLQLKALLNG